MDLQLIPINDFQAFLICLARVAGFIAAIPVLLASQTPAQVKAGLVFMVSLVLFPVMEPTLPVVSFQPLTFILLMVSEVLLGSMIGLTARMVFTAVEYGGTVIGYQMGFAAANIFDPQNQRQLSLISQFQNIFAILIFLAVDGHHVFLQVAAESYKLLPPGAFNVSGGAIPYLLKLSSGIFFLGIQFSAPILAVLLLSGLILGILARVFPQLNVFLLSFPLNIGISFTVIGLTLPLVAILLRREFDNLGERFLTILHLLN
ncbi:MAG TPA: flagellar biosynthetic protein FliR [Desulfobacterales bacterium]|nr:flagellar biosynthetic protein FliR [Desulfobacterales bacterium]HIP39820.1 flagellar biosynthetic protein FliR [Desulfocapsa sulfexigens]